MNDLAVDASGLERQFDGLNAVAGVDLRVARGEMYGFLGPNGAGKTTTVRMLTTLLKPTGGSARVAGYDIDSAPNEVRVRIGVALQEASLDDKQSGIEILRLQARLYGLHGAEIDQRVRDVTELIDIGDAIHRRVGTYSGGMKRRIDLAAALVHNPDVLFLDEPTTGLDPVSRARVWEEVRRLNAAGKTIFLTTQYLEEADALCDRVGIINEGKIAAEGTPTELKRSIGTDVISVRVDGDPESAVDCVEAVAGVASVSTYESELAASAVDGAAVIGKIAVALDGCDVDVQEITLRTPTLDDVFLDLTGGHIHEEEVQ